MQVARIDVGQDFVLQVARSAYTAQLLAGNDTVSSSCSSNLTLGPVHGNKAVALQNASAATDSSSNSSRTSVPLSSIASSWFPASPKNAVRAVSTCCSGASWGNSPQRIMMRTDNQLFDANDGET